MNANKKRQAAGKRHTVIQLVPENNGQSRQSWIEIKDDTEDVTASR
jgi:hypothetical protein